MIYVHPREDGEGDDIEGLYNPNQTALIIDDLTTGGGSILGTAQTLQQAGIIVRDAVVLMDRQQGGRQRLRESGINLVSILSLEVALNYLMSSGKIAEEWYRRSMGYLRANRPA
jgi:orotate phosphoribosyltransferase